MWGGHSQNVSNLVFAMVSNLVELESTGLSRVSSPICKGKWAQVPLDSIELICDSTESESAESHYKGLLCLVYGA